MKKSVMYTSFMQVTPCTIRINIEASWDTASTDYAEACAIYRKSPVPGYPKGNAPVILTVHRYNREIRAEAIRRCAQRLIRTILREKGIRTVGPLLILQASFDPGQKFRCTIELMLRPDVALPDDEEFNPCSETQDTRRAEIKEWLLARAECDVPEPIIRRNLEPANRDAIQPGSTLWDEAAHKALLHVVAHEVADRAGISVTEEQLEKHLEDAAVAANTTAAQLRALYNKNGQLEEVREYLLIDAVLAHLAGQNGSPHLQKT